jgi:hypothetical protein
MTVPWCELTQAAGMECFRCHKRRECEHSDEAEKRKILLHPAVVEALAKLRDAWQAERDAHLYFREPKKLKPEPEPEAKQGCESCCLDCPGCPFTGTCKDHTPWDDD